MNKATYRGDVGPGEQVQSRKKSEFTTKLSPGGEPAGTLREEREEEEGKTELSFSPLLDPHTRSPCFCWSSFDLLTFKASLVCLLSLRTNESLQVASTSTGAAYLWSGLVCRQVCRLDTEWRPLKCDFSFFSFFFGSADCLRIYRAVVWILVTDLKFDDMSNTLREEGSGWRRGGGEGRWFCSWWKNTRGQLERHNHSLNPHLICFNYLFLPIQSIECFHLDTLNLNL